MRNPSLDIAITELDAVGIRDYVIARGGKHFQLRWTFNGQPCMLTVPYTASDWRSPHNTRSDIRKLLRLDGLLATNNNGQPHTRAPAAEQQDWRRQIEDLACQLERITLPGELAAERTDIVAALQKLIEGREP